MLRTKQALLSKQFALRLISFGVLANGLLLLLNALESHLELRNHAIVASNLRITLPIIAGMTLVYLANLLNRRKQAAWLITILVYAFLFGTNIAAFLVSFPGDHLEILNIFRNLLLPGLITIGLIYYRHEFTVKSDIRNFTLSLRFIGLVLFIAFLYGVIGFMILDRRDFHEEINLFQAAHYTIDQFGLTTDHLVTTYTQRGRIFIDSLSLVSSLAIFYALISLFQPLRARLTDQTQNRKTLEELLTLYGGSSEDYFKLWPHDKGYFFNESKSAGLAFHVERGVALCVGDPIGKPRGIADVVKDFEELCKTNDWLPTHIHTEPKFSSFYIKHGYSLQKIGQEAIVSIDTFLTTTMKNKYFRHIQNKFTKQGYVAEVLMPPHHQAVIDRIKQISDEWLALPGRVERGFMLGYFDVDALQTCPIIIARDAAGTIVSFMNQMPTYDKHEISYDIFRSSSKTAGNINDFLLMYFIQHAQNLGYQKLNLGLCPLAGLETRKNDKSTINTMLRFLYSNGDRFYSFSGLYRFKSKYEPQWQDRFIAYKGGVRGFSRTINALNRTLNRVNKH